MKNIFNYFMALALASAIISCNGSTNQTTIDNTIKSFSELEKASWLIGEWQNSSAEGTTTEIWERKNDSSFFGKSYFVTGNDTVSQETINLDQNGNELVYIPTVKDQNGAQPVKFTLTNSTTNQLVFENQEHDFPQRISYTQVTTDSLLAEISGIMDGKENSQKFPMTRVIH